MVIAVLLVGIALGVILWAATKYIPMHPAIKNLMVVACVIAYVIWLLDKFGVINYLQRSGL